MRWWSSACSTATRWCRPPRRSGWTTSSTRARRSSACGSCSLRAGRFCVTFASNTPWIHQRITRLITKPSVGRRSSTSATHGGASSTATWTSRRPASPRRCSHLRDAAIPSDDWPFLYLKSRTIPRHYGGFVAFIIILGAASLLLLPRGRRGVRIPYFLMGAAFFLLETSNVVRLSILFGSTWSVNVAGVHRDSGAGAAGQPDARPSEGARDLAGCRSCCSWP